MSLLGVEAKLPWQMVGGDMAIDISQITPDMLPCQWAYVFKVPLEPPAKPKPEAEKPAPKKDPEDELKDLLLDRLGDLFK